MTAFKTDQLQALARASHNLYDVGYDISLVFFAFHCTLIGYLIFRSTVLPRNLGALMAFAALGWVTYLSPPLADYLSPYNLAYGMLGQGSVMLWLLVMGVNVQRWRCRPAQRGNGDRSAALERRPSD